MAHIKIYQLVLKSGEHSPKWSFMDWDFAQAHGFDVDAYELVYEYDEPSGSLNKVFEKFNIAHPADYKGRSLSMSDVIVKDGKAYYVDSIGFEEISSHWNR